MRLTKVQDYLPQLVADVGLTVQNCGECSRNSLNLMKSIHPLQIFPGKELLVAIWIDILELFPKSKN